MPEPETQPATPMTVLVDDTRLFKDGRPAQVARTSGQAVELLDALSGVRIDELWLDYDLLFGTTIQPFVDHLLRLAHAGDAPEIGRIMVHTSQIRAGHQLVHDLNAAGYNAVRSYRANMWVRNSTPLTSAELSLDPGADEPG